MTNIRLCILLPLLFVLTTISGAQSALDAWVQKQIDTQVDSKFRDQNSQAQQVVRQNGKGAERQRESPSNDPRSTSLVDQSSASDFIAVAANLIPVTPGLSQFVSSTGSTSSDSSAAGSTTATVSLYALLAALNRVSPTDPKFYQAHVDSRRFFLTIGTAASKQATDNTDTPATVYGAKILLINGRELYKTNNLKAIQAVQHAVAEASATSADLTARIGRLMFLALNPDAVTKDGSPDPNKFLEFEQTRLSTDAGVQTVVNSLPADTMKQIQALIQNQIKAFVLERKTLQDKYDEISQRMQMSISYTANIRDMKGNNDHRAELIFDYGLSPRINWTFNASGDYTDRKSALSSKGGRAATSFQGNLTKPDLMDLHSPLRLTFSGEGKWLTGQKPQYTFEAGLSVPLAAGIDLPIVYRYANRIAQINQKDSEARLGLSIDLSHLTQAFK